MNHTKRVLIKLSGESLAGERNELYSEGVLSQIGEHVQKMQKGGMQIALVVGGGNIFRGRTLAGTLGLKKTTAHHVGMLAIIQNGLVLRDFLRSKGIPVFLSSATSVRGMCNEHIPEDVECHLDEEKVVIFASGLAPFFSNDSTAVQRALEIGADMVIMAKNNVDGIYSDDPALNPNAEKYESISGTQVLEKGLKVADASAIALARDNNLPIKIVSLSNISASTESNVGSLIMPE